MWRRLVSSWLLAGAVCYWSTTSSIVTSYTPNHYYPALRRQMIQILRQQQPRQSTTNSPKRETSPDDDESIAAETSFIEPRTRRLMGIFRCYGWGPGCTDAAMTTMTSAPARGQLPVHQKNTAGAVGVRQTIKNSNLALKQAERSSPQSRSRGDRENSRVGEGSRRPGRRMSSNSHSSAHNGYYTPVVESFRPTTSNDASITAESSIASGQVANQQLDDFRFQPFFALTSGRSWGPTGKKRHLARRYSPNDRRINFLNQILHDMIVDLEDDSPAGLEDVGGGQHRADNAWTKRYGSSADDTSDDVAME